MRVTEEALNRSRRAVEEAISQLQANNASLSNEIAPQLNDWDDRYKQVFLDLITQYNSYVKVCIGSLERIDSTLSDCIKMLNNY